MSKSMTLTPLQSADLGEAPVPERVLIVPWGQVESSNGTFVVDEESARLAIAAFVEHGTDLPVDYEHQTLGGAYASPNGQAPAAGWITQLESDPGAGLFAHVNWTDPAREQIAARQYRYLSPVAVIRGSDRKLTALHSVALTNKPAIVGATAIVNRAVVVAEDDGPTAGESVIVAVGGAQGDADALVAASEQVRLLGEELRRRDQEELILQARKTGRLVAAQEPWARRLIAADRELFEEWLRIAAPVVPLGRMVSPRAEPSCGDRQRLAEHRARQEFKQHPEMAMLTSEAAYVALALREEEGIK